MKNIILIVAIFVGTTFSLFAQSVPQGMNYQAVARDLDGQVLADQEISLKVSLLGDGPDGKVMYSEIHDVTTSSLGLFNVVIGKGSASLGDFEEVAWGSVEVWMDIAVDLEGDYESLTTTRLLSVPYAFHAGTAGEIIGGNSSEKAAAPFWKTNGNSGVSDQWKFLGTTDANALVFKTNNQERMRLRSSGDLQMSQNNIKNLADPVDMQDAVTKVYVDGAVSAFNDHLVQDNDLSPTNELNVAAVLSGGTLKIADGGGIIAADLSSLDESAEVAAAQSAIDAHILSDGDLDPTNELQNWSNLPGIPADIADGDDVNDADSDPTNELQDWSTLPGIPAEIADGDDVVDADADPANEIQTLSQTGTDVTLSNGGGSISVADNDNDSTNELQDWSTLPGIPADIVDGDDVVDADADPANEIQTLSQTGTDVTLSNGGGSISVADNDNDSTNELQDWSTLPGIPADIVDGDDVNDADSDPTNELQNWSNLPGIPADIVDGDDVNDADSDPTNELQNWSNLPGIPVDIVDGDDVNDADSDPTNELQNWSNLPGIPADIVDGDDVNDADSDPTNELQNWSNLPGIPADIVDGDDVNDADSDPTNELQNWSNLPGIPADIVDGDDVNDADSDPTNELQNWSNLPGIPADIVDGDDVNDADSDPTNEIQTLSQTGTDVTLSNGGGNISVADNDNDSSNELNTGLNLNGTTLELTDGGGTITADLSNLGGTGSGAIIEDADQDTKIQVEESSDDDVIRFDLKGTEYFRMNKGRIDVLNTGQSVFIGEFAGYHDDGTDNRNSAVGHYSMHENITGRFNAALGYYSLYYSTNGWENTAVGSYSLYSNSSGDANTAIGYESLYKNQGGNFNSAIGKQSLYQNQSGRFNTASGYRSLYNNYGGDYNTATGERSLFSNTEGDYNTAAGDRSLYFNTEGDLNSAIGRRSLYSNTTGSNNSAIGYSALTSNTGGSNNSAIGFSADVETGDLTNATAIGAMAQVSQSNSIVLGSINGVNEATSDVNVGIGTTAPEEKLHVVGNIKIEDGNQAAGKVMTSDANGVASWQNIPSQADNLGNHSASQNIRLNSKWISNDGESEGLRVYNSGDITTSGQMTVGGEMSVGEQLTVDEELSVGGNISLNGNWLSNDGGFEGLRVTDSGNLTTSGKLTMGDNIKLSGNWLSGDGDDQGVYVTNNGNVGIGTSSPGLRFAVHRNASGNDLGGSDAYVAEFRNTSTNQGNNNDPSVLLLSANVHQPGPNTNFISFRHLSSSGNWGIGGNVEGAGNGGVKFETTGADYGEELERLDPAEEMEGTDVVGVFGGKISKQTKGADWVMAITANPAFVGNANVHLANEEDNTREIVAFIGQIPVKVRGDVNIGDYILASGLEDGTAIAVAPEELRADQSNKIVGRAWEAATGELNLVNTVVGLPEAASTNGALLRKIEAQQQEIEALKAKNDQMSADIQAIKAMLSQ